MRSVSCPGPHVETVKCNRDYQPPCAADKNATDCDINAIRQCPDLIKIIEKTEKFYVVLDFSGYEPKWIHDNCLSNCLANILLRMRDGLGVGLVSNSE